MDYILKIRRGLFTKEDKFDFHKILGLLCLGSYIFRFANWGSNDMKFDGSFSTLVTLLAHTCLSVSSLVFKLPTRRITEGSRIWPEYRLHSIIFACRSLLCMLVMWLEVRYGWSPMYAANAIIVIGTLAAADVASWYVGPNGRSSTIQELHAPAGIRYCFSVMQFHATIGCLVGLRFFSSQFMYVFIIQFTAFLMTLRRKNLLPHMTFVYIYGVMLAFGFATSCNEVTKFACGFAMVNCLANFAAILRLGLRMNKYVMWLGMAVVTSFARESTLSESAGSEALRDAWPYLYIASVIGVIYMGIQKVVFAEAKSAQDENGKEAERNHVESLAGKTLLSKQPSKGAIDITTTKHISTKKCQDFANKRTIVRFSKD